MAKKKAEKCSVCGKEPAKTKTLGQNCYKKAHREGMVGPGCKGPPFSAREKLLITTDIRDTEARAKLEDVRKKFQKRREAVAAALEKNWGIRAKTAAKAKAKKKAAKTAVKKKAAKAKPATKAKPSKPKMVKVTTPETTAAASGATV